MKINTNLSSLIVQSCLKASTNGLNTAIERMTTGFKINHAKDNVANYSINTKLSSKISAYQVAEDNALMGLELVQTASKSLSTMSNLGLRLMNLAVSAANGTNASSSIAALNKEAEQLIGEIYREKNNCKYNDIALWGDEVNFHNDAMDLKLNSQGFLKEVKVRDTSSMTALSSVDSNTVISSGAYKISSAEELAKLAEMVNAGKVTGGEFVLAADIDLSIYSSGVGWTTIGNEDNSFQACFDGNGHTISNLYINSGSGGKGLFGKIESGSEVKNLRLTDVYIRASWTSGVVCSSVASGGIVTNCSVEGGTMEDSSNGAIYGGIAGNSAEGGISYCYTDLDLNLRQQVGGIVGIGYAEYCLSNATITTVSSAGGICGRGGYVTNSAFSGRIVSDYASIGGIIGEWGSATDCYFSGTISGTYNVGGIIGTERWGHNMSNNYVAGSVQGTNNTGIFVGSLSSNISLTNSYYDSSKIAGLPVCGLGNFKECDVVDTFAFANWDFQVGINSTDSSILNYTMHMENLGLYDILNSGLNSPNSLAVIDNFLSIIENEQTKIGAIENRLESALEQIGVAYDNLVSTRSTILDADIAEESSAYIRNQILQQAAMTLMATANQTPAIALQLL